MKIKSLLAAVSMVALSATAANAITVTQNGTDFQAPLALELDLATTAVTGTVTVDISPDTGFFNQGVQHTVVVDLPAGMQFNGVVQGADLTGSGGATGNVFSGGQNNGTSVTFQIAPVNTTTGTFTAVLAVKATSCLAEGSGVNAIVSTAGGFVNNDADGDNTGSTVGMGFGGCASAWDGVVDGSVPGAAGGDTLIALGGTPEYSTISGDANLGTITYAIDPTVAVDSTGTAMALADLATPAVVSTITLAGNPAMNGAVLSVGNGNGTLTGGPVTWTLTQTAAQAVAGAQIDVAAGTVTLPNMQPTVTAATSSFLTANGFISSEVGATGPLEALQRDGQTFGAFDWNSGGNGAGTLSVYRITGLAPNATTAFSADLTNSNANGIVTGTVTADATGEAVITSNNLGGSLPAGVVRYDFTLNLETNNAVDVDRLLLRNGIVSAFNDASNWNTSGSPQPFNDDDSGSE